MQPNWFIALEAPLPHELIESFSPPPRVRRFHPADLHITVAFLGGVSEEVARRAWALAAAHPWEPMEATLGEVVPMGKPERYSALSAELDHGLAEVTALIAALRGPCLTAAGRPPDRWEIRPHVTLARPQRKATEAQRDAALAWGRSLPTRGVPLRLETLSLYTWARDRQTRLFEVVERAATD